MNAPPSRHTLPPWAEWLLLRLASGLHRDAVVGDFAEVYRYRAEKQGRARALGWFWGQVLKSLPAFLLNGIDFGGAMFRNYLTVALRNLVKRRFFTALNVGGLAIGMAACLLIFQYVAFEQSYDRFHPGAEHIFRVNIEHLRPSGESNTVAFTWIALGPTLAEQVPGIEVMARYHPNFGDATLAVMEGTTRRDAFRESRVAFVDPAFLSMFDFPLVAGDPATALTQPHTILLSASTARRYFGDGDPIGQLLDVRAWTDSLYTVAGVFADVPPNSHVRFDVLMPLSDLLTEHPMYADSDGWGIMNLGTYLRLTPGADLAEVSRQASALINTQFEDELTTEGGSYAMPLQPLPDIHLKTDFDADYADQNSERTVYFFTLVAFFILLIAWVNYVNLSTARAMERAREVGVRKAVGAQRGQVVSQFLIEAALVNGVALVLALGLAALALPWLNALAGVEISASVWRDPTLWAGFVLVFGLGGALASAYPAFVLSSFRPVAVLKGRLGRLASQDALRKGLVVFQFAASMALLMGTFAAYRQVDFMRSRQSGFDLDQVLVVEAPSFQSDHYLDDRTLFKNEVLKQAAIRSVAVSAAVPGQGHNLNTSAYREGAPETEMVSNVKVSWISEEFPETYGLRIVAGRNMDADITSDFEDGVVLNETGVEAFGFASAEEAVGKWIVFPPSNRVLVIGVFEDTHWTSVKEPIAPTLLTLTRGGRYYSIRVATADLPATLDAVRATYDAVFPGNAFHYFFADKHFDEQYRADERFGMLFGLFAGFALLVACLGLVGLAAYTASQRTKEIGIRKVLGARPMGIVRLLATDFAKLVVVAFVVAAPLTYFGIEAWLDSFANRVSVDGWMLALPGLVVLAFALLTVSYHTLRTALTDPVRSLRYD